MNCIFHYIQDRTITLNTINQCKKRMNQFRLECTKNNNIVKEIFKKNVKSTQDNENMEKAKKNIKDLSENFEKVREMYASLTNHYFDCLKGDAESYQKIVQTPVVVLD